MVDWEKLISMVFRIAAVLICIMVHEVSHGLAAYALGDPTAKQNHRLSLNPIRHIDPFGLLMMIVAGFGWAKPVPVDARYFKKPKSGMALTALAGPLSNFILAYLSVILLQLALVGQYVGGGIGWSYWIDFLTMLLALNIGLGLFNLIPFPPLDGSKIVGMFLPDRIYFQWMRYEQYGMFALMAILFLGWLDGPLYAVRDWVFHLMWNGSMFVQHLALSWFG